MSTAMFTTLHGEENKVANGWRISRWKFFVRFIPYLIRSFDCEKESTNPVDLDGGLCRRLSVVFYSRTANAGAQLLQRDHVVCAKKCCRCEPGT